MPRAHNPESGPPGAPSEAYFRELDRTPLLDAEQERELARRVQAGDHEARDRLVRANLRLVVSLARRYSRGGLALEDLVAEGNLGLLRAVDGFDPSMNTRFSTYAAYWIKQSIRQALVRTARAVRIPTYMAQLLGRWRRAAAELDRELGRAPTPEEVAGRLGLSARRARLVQDALRVRNAAWWGGSGGEAPALEELAGDGAGPDARLWGAEELRLALGLLDRLGGRLAAVLRMRFGLGDEGPMTLAEVGERLGLTRERVRQIECAGLRELQEALAAP